MIEVKSVVRQDRVVRQVTIGSGAVEITYILVDGKPKEIARINLDKQVLDDQSLVVSHADYRQAIKVAPTIFREKRP